MHALKPPWTPIRLAVSLLGCCLACSDAPQNTAIVPPVVTDSAGVSIIESATPQWTRRERFTISRRHPPKHREYLPTSLGPALNKKRRGGEGTVRRRICGPTGRLA